jgi:hypothetical protein
VATALWHDGVDGDRQIRVGEVVDLRVAQTARGSPVARALLASVQRAFEEVGVHWYCATIGEANRAARRLVEGKAGLPALAPLDSYVSAHLLALRIPHAAGRGLSIRKVGLQDVAEVEARIAALRAPLRLRPATPFRWGTSGGEDRGWIARNGAGDTVGLLVVWDGSEVRRIRVDRYSRGDALLRTLTRLLAPTGLVNPLPPPGGALRLWASRALWNRDGTPAVSRALVVAALAAAARAGAHVVQVNSRSDDPVVGHLRRFPGSSFRSRLFGRPGDPSRPEPPARDAGPFYTELALV